MGKIKTKKAKDCNINDKFFDSLKEDYVEFEDWFKKVADRDVYVVECDNKLHAMMMLKDECEEIKLKNIVLPTRARIKICTLKIDESMRNMSIGKKFLHIALLEFLKQNKDELYVTAYPSKTDLINLLCKIYFEDRGEKDNTEHVYVLTKEKANKALQLLLGKEKDESNTTIY